ncbi:hypothetical protein SmJEL517_g04227 [Synchytrium microbalum]|uniref:Mediator of RNA polymerase II transcription subunit 6 n=1 Tax=Synchytrium microbalum TaxID=1806994 RepID=A0A507C5G3_9FUNG|nr:uncharacterized protein SmJEL517_g04227 [Synchytrium microbalum]TPX32685.1 hypothetical protein SmJEL517_g04227 [Synchytrium microbalum]
MNNQSGQLDNIAQVPEDDLTDVSFINPNFLKYYGQLTHDNVLAYFAESQFYSRDSINENIVMQTRYNPLEASQLNVKALTGTVYDILDHVADVGLWVIGKWNRVNETTDDLVAVYYIVDNTIYQAPDIHTLIANRVSSSLQALSECFSSILPESAFIPSRGHMWNSDVEILEKLGKANTTSNNKPSLEEEAGAIESLATEDEDDDPTVAAIHNPHLMHDELVASQHLLDSIVLHGGLLETSSVVGARGTSRLASLAPSARRNTPPVRSSNVSSPAPSMASASSTDRKRKFT